MKSDLAMTSIRQVSLRIHPACWRDQITKYSKFVFSPATYLISTLMPLAPILIPTSRDYV